MGHTRRSPIRGVTPAGVGSHYIIVESFEDTVNIQCNVNGTVTYAVDWTNQNIFYGTTALEAVNVATPNNQRYAPPGAADWTNFIVSGAADATGQLQFPVFAIRIDITGGTGSVNYHITQG